MVLSRVRLTAYAGLLPASFRQHCQVPDSRDACWLWTGPVGPTGWPKGARGQNAQLWSYRLHLGAVGKGFRPEASCGNKLCVSPYHLLLRKVRY